MLEELLFLAALNSTPNSSRSSWEMSTTSCVKFAAKTMTGINDHKVMAIPHDQTAGGFEEIQPLVEPAAQRL